MSNSDLLAVNTVRYVHDKMSLNWRSELENKIPLIWKVLPSAAIWVLCNYGKKIHGIGNDTTARVDRTTKWGMARLNGITEPLYPT